MAYLGTIMVWYHYALVPLWITVPRVDGGHLGSNAVCAWVGTIVPCSAMPPSPLARRPTAVRTSDFIEVTESVRSLSRR
jgi:hypothetical protein